MNGVHGEIIIARLNKTLNSVVVGDEVVATYLNDDELVVTEILPRQNLFYRSYGEREKFLAANLDHIYIVMAPLPLFNHHFIDRALVAAAEQGICATLVINKADLDLNPLSESINLYRNVGVPVMFTSSLTASGTLALLESLKARPRSQNLLCGISGVGKSSIVNQLLPEANLRTNTTSDRSGLGRQTTTQSFCHTLNFEEGATYLIDSPGLQSFGLNHIERVDLQRGFYEIFQRSSQCKFSPCYHRHERDCQVKSDLEANLIDRKRYESYLTIDDEIQGYLKTTYGGRKAKP